MTRRRWRRLHRLINRSARAWALADRHDGYSVRPAQMYRDHLRMVVSHPDPDWARQAERGMRRGWL